MTFYTSYTFSYFPVLAFFTNRMMVPFLGCVQNFFLMMPVGPTKPFFIMSPLQNRLKTCLVEGINFFTAACAAFKAVEIAPLPVCLSRRRRLGGFLFRLTAIVSRWGW